MNKFEKVARMVGTTPGALRDAMDDVGRERCRYYVSISVKGVQHGRMSETRRSSALWRVAELLHIEPEDLRDAIAEVYDPPEGEVVTITHRVRLPPDHPRKVNFDRDELRERGRRQMMKRNRGADGRILPGWRDE